MMKDSHLLDAQLPQEIPHSAAGRPLNMEYRLREFWALERSLKGTGTHFERGGATSQLHLRQTAQRVTATRTAAHAYFSESEEL